MRAMDEGLLLCSEGPWLYFLGGLAWMENWKMDVIFTDGKGKKKKKKIFSSFSLKKMCFGGDPVK